MIINGGSRSNGRFFASHLMRADHNERVELRDIRGLLAENVPEAFREMQTIACGTACKNFFYHADINTREDERLTPEQWAEAVDTLERELNLTGQPRLIVEHEKNGRTHQHIIWSRIDAESMTAISDSHNYRRHETVARALEKAFEHAPTRGTLSREYGAERPERGPKDAEAFRAQESGIDPKAMKAELTALWRHADSGQAFAAALAEQGYILTRGDRRDFCVIDRAGDEHSLARRLDGVKAAELRARLADVDRAALPSVAEGREIARQRMQPAGDGGAAVAPPEAVREAPEADRTPEGERLLSDFEAILAETLRAAELAPTPSTEATVAAPSATAEERAIPASDFDAILAATVAQAQAESARSAQEDGEGGRYSRWRSWLDGMREYVAGWWDRAQEWLVSYFGRDEPDGQSDTRANRGAER